MIPETAIIQLLSADSAVTDICSTRITPVAVRIDAGVPAVTVARQAGSRTYTYNGSPDATVTIGCTAWAAEWTPARLLAEAMREALDMASGNGIEVAGVTDGADTYDPDAGLFGCTIVVAVQYSEE